MNTRQIQEQLLINSDEKQKDDELKRKLQEVLGFNSAEIEIQYYDENAHLEQRDKAIQGIASDMKEVNQLMQTAADLVAQDAPKVDAIADNIQMASAYVQKGEKALEKKDEQQRKSMCCSIV